VVFLARTKALKANTYSVYTKICKASYFDPVKLTQPRISDSSLAKGMGNKKERKTCWRGFQALVY
jgi:hypothetical protein